MLRAIFIDVVKSSKSFLHDRAFIHIRGAANGSVARSSTQPLLCDLVGPVSKQ